MASQAVTAEAYEALVGSHLQQPRSPGGSRNTSAIVLQGPPSPHELLCQEPPAQPSPAQPSGSPSWVRETQRFSREVQQTDRPRAWDRALAPRLLGQRHRGKLCLMPPAWARAATLLYSCLAQSRSGLRGLIPCHRTRPTCAPHQRCSVLCRAGAFPRPR